MADLQYQIAFTSVPFDNSYANTIRFETREAQKSYFNTSTIFANAPYVNFNFGDGISTQLVARLDLEPNNRLNVNYAIVKDNRPEANIQYYYYFVNNVQYDNAIQAIYDLELDVMQTYYYDLDFSPCLITRTHLDRFVKTDQETIKFNTDNQYLYQSEPITNVPKIMQARQKAIPYYPCTGSLEPGSRWLDNAVLGWMYAFVDASGIELLSGSPKYTELEYEEDPIDSIGARIPLPYLIVCQPIMRSGYDAYLSDNGATAVLWGGINVFLNVYAPYIYSVKISSIAPFNRKNANFEKFTVDGNSFTYDPPILNFIHPHYNILCLGGMDATVISLMIDKSPILTAHPFVFNLREIINANTSYKFNPKMASGNYMDIVISNGISDNYTYDYQKLQNLFVYKLYETPVADITRAYFALYGGLYTEDYQQSYHGLTVSWDNSYPYTANQLTTYLANNKNFYLQRNMNLEASRVRNAVSALSGGMNIAAGGGNQVTRGVNIGVDYVMGEYSTYLQYQNSEFMLDNMRYAPDTLINNNGGIFHNLAIAPLGYYIEYYDILEADRERINMFMNMFGYSYNNVGKIKDFDHSRKYYNYIKAELQNTSFVNNISNIVRRKFREIFANGIRLWHSNGSTPSFDYTPENYERILEA